MTLDDFKTWQTSFTLCTVSAVGAYAVLLLQSFFHESRIAIAGLLGGLACAAVTIVADDVYLVVAVIAGLLVFGFSVLSIAANIRQPKFWLPLAIFLLTAPAAGGAYWYIYNATAAS